ncbi:hypothetical protein ACFY1J_43790 [Streptomyces sp. NPDC001406]
MSSWALVRATGALRSAGADVVFGGLAAFPRWLAGYRVASGV